MVSSKMDFRQHSCNHIIRQIHHIFCDTISRIRKMYQRPRPGNDIDDREDTDFLGGIMTAV